MSDLMLPHARPHFVSTGQSKYAVLHEGGEAAVVSGARNRALQLCVISLSCGQPHCHSLTQNYTCTDHSVARLGFFWLHWSGENSIGLVEEMYAAFVNIWQVLNTTMLSFYGQMQRFCWGQSLITDSFDWEVLNSIIWIREDLSAVKLSSLFFDKMWHLFTFLKTEI